MDNNEEKKGLLELIKSIPIPDIIRNNALTALAKGIGNIITSASNIPIAYFDSKAEEIKATSNAKIKIINTASDEASKIFNTNSELANRALKHFGSKIIEEQVNREQVAKKTIDNLRELPEGNFGDEKIDEDWVSLFWKLAETKTREDVQEILAKILTKEIVKPKSISPNTLQLLTILTSDLGDSLRRLSNLSIDDGNSCYVIHPNVFAFQNIGPLFDYDISYDDLFELDGAGLIRSAETIRVNYAKDENQEFDEVNYAGKKARLNVSGLQIQLLQFTKSGKELRNLIELTPNFAYTNKIKEYLKDSFVLEEKETY